MPNQKIFFLVFVVEDEICISIASASSVIGNRSAANAI